MKKITFGLVLLALLASSTGMAQQYECLRWQTITTHDSWGNRHTETRCVESAPVVYHRHHYGHQHNRGHDVLLGVVIGAGAYHLARDRRRTVHHHHYRGHHGGPRNCHRRHDGVWRCR